MCRRQARTSPSTAGSSAAVRAKPRPSVSLDLPSLFVPLWSLPCQAGLVPESVDRLVDRGEEMRGIDRPSELVTLDLGPHRILHLREHQVDAAGVQLLIEILEHV